MDTIKSARDIDRLFKEGRRAGRRTLIVLAAQSMRPRGPESGRVVFVAGKRIGGAVQRNRCKRVLRAACRRIGGPWDMFDVALIARHAAINAAAERIDADLESALRELGVEE